MPVAMPNILTLVCKAINKICVELRDDTIPHVTNAPPLHHDFVLTFEMVETDDSSEDDIGWDTQIEGVGTNLPRARKDNESDGKQTTDSDSGSASSKTEQSQAAPSRFRHLFPRRNIGAHRFGHASTNPSQSNTHQHHTTAVSGQIDLDSIDIEGNDTEFGTLSP